MNEQEEDLQRVLDALQPAITWPAALSAANMAGPDVWQWEDPDLWPMSGPHEDYALAPLMPWDDDLRRLAQKAYEATYDKWLEPGESYELAWPPRGTLWTPGAWSWSQLDDEPNDEIGEGTHTVIEPASWMWHLEVERVGENSVETEEPWLMGRTDVDPTTVEYSVFGGAEAHRYVEVLQKVVRAAIRPPGTTGVQI